MNRASYDAIAPKWAEVRVALSEAEQRLIELACENLLAGSKVLDLGCGTGQPIGDYLVQKEFRITGVDQSEGMLSLARKRLPKEEWVLSSLEEFRPRDKFSVVIAWDALFHIPRSAHESIFSYIKQALFSGGRFALTVGGSEHPAFADTMFEHEFFYDSHPPEMVMEMLKSLGFELVHTEFLNLPTSGRDKGRFAVVAQAI